VVVGFHPDRLPIVNQIEGNDRIAQSGGANSRGFEMFKRFSLSVLVSLVLAFLIVGVGVAPASAASDESVAYNAVHVVRRGETLYSIARSHGVDMRAIVRANGITNPNYIYAGQRLTIPTGRPSGTSSPTTRVHVVQSGETLYRIALRYGTSVWAITRTNNIANPNCIYAGQRLVIP
jgi:LysM repeat protein